MMIKLAMIIVALLLMAFTFDVADPARQTVEPARDLLVYISHRSFWIDDIAKLMLYDPATNVHRLLYASTGLGTFQLSSTGKIALTKRKDSALYIIDIYQPDQALININPFPYSYAYPIEWSPDGRYLAFVRYESEGNRSLFLWDGDSTINLHATFANISARQVSWSPDGRYLAFVSFAGEYTDSLHVWDGNGIINLNAPVHTNISVSQFSWSYNNRLVFVITGEDLRGEIYLWNGQGNTISNLSQNPLSDDNYPIWNQRGELAFFSETDRTYQISIWDGISMRDSQPDQDSFMIVAPKHRIHLYYVSFPVWTAENYIAFEAQTDDDRYLQTYVWDGENVKNISQNPHAHNGMPQWSQTGLFAFITFFSSEQSLYIRDADNRTVLRTDGMGAVAWSSDGNLIFCNYLKGLMLWNGQISQFLIRDWEISAQWQSGASAVCSSG